MRKFVVAGTHLAGEVLKKRRIRPPKVEFEFTDLDLTGFGGASILARTALRFGLFELLEEAIVAAHRPGGWDAEQHYVVVRRRTENGQMLLIPQRTVILVSRDDLPLAELVLRHRGKQGQGNAFKGLLRDMDLHHPPCRGYRANQAFYALGQIALFCCARCSMGRCRKARVGTASAPVIRHVMRATAHMVRPARRVCVRFAKTNFRLD